MARGPYFVYILTNKSNRVLYTGVTNNILRRVEEHRKGAGASFTKRYNANKLVFYEAFSDIRDALQAEKRIKGWSRRKKIDLINRQNPDWESLL